MSEVLFLDGNISVDGHFARFNDKSYAINKINSVEVKRIAAKPNSKNVWIVLAVLCLLVAIGAQSAGWIVGAIFFGAFAYQAYRNPNKDSFQLYLMTSSSEVQALVTQDADQISRLRAAIEAAMSRS